MRFPLPPKKLRRHVTTLLRDFYQEHDVGDFRAAWQVLCDFYQIKPPVIRWRRRIEGGKTWGLTHSDNIVELLLPAWFARQEPPDNTEEQWCATTLHEFWHVLSMVDAEQKADAFAARFLEDE